MNDLLRGQHNIASTHALFYKYNSETLDLIRSGHYTLILDEVIDVLEFIDVASSDIDILFEAGIVDVEPDTRRVVWARDDYKGCFDGLRNKVESGCVTYENNRLVVWQLPLEVFEAFDEVIVLTYMFSAQYQSYYYKMHNVDVDYIGVRHIDGLEYEFVPGLMQEKITLPTIHLCANNKMNAIGRTRTALSVSWYNGTGAEELRRNLYNFFRNMGPNNSKLRLWSTYNDNRKSLQGNGYTRRFLAYNTRATNAYRECSHLAYAVNIFANVNTQIYFAERGYTIDNDKLATSEMVQWLWRSRLRDGKEIWLYLPSSRMRRLLYKWVKDVTGNVECIEEWE